jgi:hypothetical protein
MRNTKAAIAALVPDGENANGVIHAGPGNQQDPARQYMTDDICAARLN